jgi:hypothetical protein
MTRTTENISTRQRWRRFTVGLLLLAALVTFLASGYAPPGVCGEVLRHNQEAKIDASPFFYGDVANMAQIERDLQLTRRAAKLREAEENLSKDTSTVNR